MIVAPLTTALVVLATAFAPQEGATPPRPATPDAAEAPPVGSVPVVEVLGDGPRLAGFLIRTDPQSGQLAIIGGQNRLQFVERQAVDLKSVRNATPDEVPVQALVQGLQHADKWIQDHCQEILERSTSCPAKPLGALLSGAPEDVTRRVLSILWRQPKPALRNQVRSHLSDADEQVRVMALRAYAALKPDDLLSQCDRLLRKDKSTWVQYVVLDAMGQVEEARAVDLLIENLDALTDESLRRQALQSLRRLTGRTYDQGRVWRNWWANERDRWCEEHD